MAATSSDIVDLAERAARDFGPGREQLGAALRARAAEVVDLQRRLVDDAPDIALRLAAALPAFWEDLGRLDDGRRLTVSAIERAVGREPALASAHVAASELAFRQGDREEATRHARIAIELATAVGDHRVTALAHVNLARVAYRDGNASEIQSHAERALELAPSDPAARRGGLHMMAWAAHTAGDQALARQRFQDSLDLRRSQGDRFGAAVELANLGDLAAEDGDLAAAAEQLGEALIVAADVDSAYLIVNLLPSLAVLAARAGDDDAAARLLGAADSIGRHAGITPDPGAWQPPLAEAERRLGDRFDALRHEGQTLGTADAVSLAARVAASIRSRDGRP